MISLFHEHVLYVHMQSMFSILYTCRPSAFKPQSINGVPQVKNNGGLFFFFLMSLEPNCVDQHALERHITQFVKPNESSRKHVLKMNTFQSRHKFWAEAAWPSVIGVW